MEQILKNKYDKVFEKQMLLKFTLQVLESLEITILKNHRQTYADFYWINLKIMDRSIFIRAMRSVIIIEFLIKIQIETNFLQFLTTNFQFCYYFCYCFVKFCKYGNSVDLQVQIWIRNLDSVKTRETQKSGNEILSHYLHFLFNTVLHEEEGLKD